MNKPDITKGKDSGPKDIKGKGNRPKDIKANGSGHKDSISDKIEIPLNADISLSDFFNNRLLIIQTIEKGIPFSIFELIKNVTPLTTNDWADYLGLSARSLNRYFIQNKTFSPIYTEKIIELVEVFKLGLEVFGDQNSFNQWLNTPNFALGKIKPFELLKNSYGKEMVISELTGISHGILV